MSQDLADENEHHSFDFAAASKADRIAALATSAANCKRCLLSTTRTNVVFGEGNPESPMMVIGEGPGQNEDATGRPFVGRAGLLLDECLRENGITRKHVYICNVVRCRACNVEGSRVTNRPPLPVEIEACAPWLDQTIAIISPLVILSLGAPSASAIIHAGFRMGQERGKWFQSRYAPHVIASWHPAYILRQVGPAFDSSRRLLVEDIAAARVRVIEAKRARAASTASG